MRKVRLDQLVADAPGQCVGKVLPRLEHRGLERNAEPVAKRLERRAQETGHPTGLGVLVGALAAALAAADRVGRCLLAFASDGARTAGAPLAYAIELLQRYAEEIAAVRRDGYTCMRNCSGYFLSSACMPGVSFAASPSILGGRRHTCDPCWSVK